jgi:hypothetical protein
MQGKRLRGRAGHGMGLNYSPYRESSMAMYKEDRFSAALKMIQVTPENFKTLTPAVILHVYEVIAEAEKQLKQQEDIASVNEKKRR